MPVVLSNGVNASVSLNTGLTLNKSVYGTGSLIKSGAGSLILASTNRYDGDTVVNGGLLKLVPLPDGTQAYYTFDDPNHLGADSSARDNHLVAGTGSPTYSDAGVFGGALYVNGSSTLIRQTFPAGVPTGSTPYTIALWMRDDGSPNTGGFCGWGNNANNQCNNLRLAGAHGLKNYWYANDFEVSGLSTNLKDGEWHHIAVTWDGLTQTMYVDGVPVRTTSRTGLNAQGINFVVGKTTSDVGFKGYIDNLLIADRAFTAAGIVAIMQTLMHSGSNGLLPPEGALHLATGGVLDLNGADQSFSSLNGVGRVANSRPLRSLSPSAVATLTVPLAARSMDRSHSPKSAPAAWRCRASTAIRAVRLSRPARWCSPRPPSNRSWRRATLGLTRRTPPRSPLMRPDRSHCGQTKGRLVPRWMRSRLYPVRAPR